jgi:hypothetical protein
MGQDEYLEEKVANLNKILPMLEGQKGTLHLENFTGHAESVPFSPSGEVDSATEGSDTDGESEENGTAEDGTAAEDSGSESTGADSVLAGVDGSVADAQEDAQEEEADSTQSSATIPMVFNSSGTLVYNVHIENGVVVDSSGAEVPGVTVNEDGNVVDAYMNVFDSDTGDLIQ